MAWLKDKWRVKSKKPEPEIFDSGMLLHTNSEIKAPERQPDNQVLTKAETPEDRAPPQQPLKNHHRYEETFRALYPVMVIFAQGYVRRRDIAEERVQEAFFRLLRHWRKYVKEEKTEQDLRNLMYRIVSNLCIDYSRGSKNPGDATEAGDEELEITDPSEDAQPRGKKSGAIDRTSPQERAFLNKEDYMQWEKRGKLALGETNFHIHLMDSLEFDSIDIKKKLKLNSAAMVRTRLHRMQAQVAALKQGNDDERK